MELINTNNQRVEPTEGVRLKAGQVGHFDGVDADRLLALDGVHPLDSDEGDEYVKAHPEVVTSEASASLVLSDALTAVSRAQAVITQAPQQRVIGDDEAPLGPPTGTVTTRHQQAELSPVDAAAFAPNEALASEAPEERIPESRATRAGSAFDAAKEQGSASPQRDVQAQAAADVQPLVEEIVGAMHSEADNEPRRARGRARGGGSAAAEAQGEDSGEPVNYAKQGKPDLEKLAADRELDVTGTGADGNVTKDDLVKALSEDDENADDGDEQS